MTVAENITVGVELLLAERDENIERLDFAPSEAVALSADIEPHLRAEAAERKATSNAERVNFTPSDTGKSRDKVAAAVGLSALTLARAQEVVAAAETEPQKYGPLVVEMDRTRRAQGPRSR